MATIIAGAVGAVIVVLAVVAVVGVLHAVDLEHRVNRVTANLQAAVTDVGDGRIGAAQTTLATAEGDLTSINSALYNSPDFSVLDTLPVSRQNIEAVRSSVALGLQLVAGGQRVLYAASPLVGPDGHLDVSLSGGQVPLGTIHAVQQALRHASVTRLIHGHTHRPAVHALQLDDHPAERIVLGDWYEHGSVLKVTPAGAELHGLSVA